jgi:hypothetical protein
MLAEVSQPAALATVMDDALVAVADGAFTVASNAGPPDQKPELLAHLIAFEIGHYQLVNVKQQAAVHRRDEAANTRLLT